MSNYTPGPWKVRKTFYGETYIEGKDGYYVCAFPVCFPNKKDVVMIAAAPEMLEVIHDLLEPAYERYQYVLETDTPDEAEVYKETIDQAEALLRRIEGEEDHND